MPATEGAYEQILVPVKIGPIGEEMLATAIKLAEERGGTIHALHVIRVPLDLPLDAEMLDEEERASASLIDAKLLAAEHGVEIESDVVRARAIGEAIVQKAEESRRRPDRAGLRAALAPAVALLQPHRRLRAAPRPLRGDGDRVPAGRSRGGDRPVRARLSA